MYWSRGRIHEPPVEPWTCDLQQNSDQNFETRTFLPIGDSPTHPTCDVSEYKARMRESSMAFMESYFLPLFSVDKKLKVHFESLYRLGNMRVGLLMRDQDLDGH